MLNRPAAPISVKPVQYATVKKPAPVQTPSWNVSLSTDKFSVLVLLSTRQFACVEDLFLLLKRHLTHQNMFILVSLSLHSLLGICTL